MSTAAQRLATKLRSRKWRKAHPETGRAYAARYKREHPPTPEQRAKKVENTRAWRLKHAAKLKTYATKRWLEKGPEINARRRAKAATNREAERARQAAWRAANPGHSRSFYRRYREKFTGNGPWSARSKRFKRAWRTFTKTCAASRARITQEQIQC